MEKGGELLWILEILFSKNLAAAAPDDRHLIAMQMRLVIQLKYGLHTQIQDNFWCDRRTGML